MALTKITSSLVAINSLTAANIADNAVDATKIASNSILTRHIDDNQVTTDQIAANTIATANIADNAVDGTKIASNSILTRHIDDDQVTADQIVDNIALAGNVSTTGNFGVGAAPTNGGLTTAGSPVLAISGTVPELNFVDTSSSANDYWIRVSDGLQFGEAGDSRMYLKNGGNLGIGTTSPATNLHIGSGTEGENLGLKINRGATTNFLVACDGTKQAYIGVDNSQSYIKLGSLSNHSVQISQNNASAIYIDTNKKVGIGTTSPSGILTISDGGDGEINFTDGGTNAMVMKAGAGDELYIGSDNTYTFRCTNNARRDLLVDNGAFVGIGTSSPNQALEVNGKILLSNNQEIRFKDSGGNERTALALDSSNNLNIGTSAGGNLKFINGSSYTERMRLTSGGGLLFGTTVNQLYDTQSQTGLVFHDDNSYASCGAHLEMANSADIGWSLQYLQRFNWNSGDDGRFLQFAVNGGSDVGNITYDGTNFSVTNGSDYRLKENIVDYTGGLAKINALKVRSFNKKEGASKDITQQGFIAHELSEHIPNAVIGTKDAMKVDETGETVPAYQQVTREALVPYLVSAIQEQQVIIDSALARIKTLEDA